MPPGAGNKKADPRVGFFASRERDYFLVASFAASVPAGAELGWVGVAVAGEVAGAAVDEVSVVAGAADAAGAAASFAGSAGLLASAAGVAAGAGAGAGAEVVVVVDVVLVVEAGFSPQAVRATAASAARRIAFFIGSGPLH